MGHIATHLQYLQSDGLYVVGLEIVQTYRVQLERKVTAYNLTPCICHTSDFFSSESIHSLDSLKASRNLVPKPLLHADVIVVRSKS